MNGIVIGALVALSMAQQTDTTFAVGDAERLNVETLGGSITVSVWDNDRNDVRVQAEHSSRTFVDISRNRLGISVDAEARRGPANLVDFHVTVPRRLALKLEANYGDILVDDSDGTIDAETVQGEITVRGGRGTIELSTSVGNIHVEGAEGRIEIESSAGDVRVVDSGGEIFAESAGGSIILENVDARAVDVGSTGGRVYFDGNLDPAGTYFFGSHGGSVTIVVPEGARASFNLATIHGSIGSNLDGEARGFKGGERHSFDVGGGGALVEAETYGGRIRLLRRGSEGAQAPRMRTPREVREMAFGSGEGHGWAGFMDDATGWLGDIVSVAVAPAVSAAVAPAVSAAMTQGIAAEIAVVIEGVPSVHREAPEAPMAPAPRRPIRR